MCCTYNAIYDLLIYDTFFLIETQIHATRKYMTLYDFFNKEDTNSCHA